MPSSLFVAKAIGAPTSICAIWPHRSLFPVLAHGRKNWRSGLDEFYRSFSKTAFVRALQRLVPAVQPTDLMPGGSGVRAQAVTREARWWMI